MNNGTTNKHSTSMERILAYNAGNGVHSVYKRIWTSDTACHYCHVEDFTTEDGAIDCAIASAGNLLDNQPIDIFVDGVSIF